MPFDHPIPRPLNSRSVMLFAPNQSGVYGISTQHEWVYVGESDDIRSALLLFLEVQEKGGRDNDILARPGFVFETCARGSRHGRQDQLVREYEPRRNRREF